MNNLITAQTTEVNHELDVQITAFSPVLMCATAKDLTINGFLVWFNFFISQFIKWDAYLILDPITQHPASLGEGKFRFTVSSQLIACLLMTYATNYRRYFYNNGKHFHIRLEQGIMNIPSYVYIKVFQVFSIMAVDCFLHRVPISNEDIMRYFIRQTTLMKAFNN